MAVKRISIPLNQGFERVAVSREDALDYELISVVLINYSLISPKSWLRRLHDNRVTHFPRFGQVSGPAVPLEKVRHVNWTRQPRWSNTPFRCAIGTTSSQVQD
jgi:hypothetical protein